MKKLYAVEIFLFLAIVTFHILTIESDQDKNGKYWGLTANIMLLILFYVFAQVISEARDSGEFQINLGQGAKIMAILTLPGRSSIIELWTDKQVLTRISAQRLAPYEVLDELRVGQTLYRLQGGFTTIPTHILKKG